MNSLYLDTSALVKWYLPEEYSDEFETFISAIPGAHISSLATVEFRCALNRRRRAGEIPDELVGETYLTFTRQVDAGYLNLLPMNDSHFQSAAKLVELSTTPLRTLDALHLAAAQNAGCSEFATADRILAGSAHNLGFIVHPFFDLRKTS
ncbi:MAG: type II toxin-antitoxin system VapC family toxin [Sulfuricella sp.]|nr:type II toxin-antitoxin system VapC family toxin [Sulfuricella sp.]